MKISYNWLKEYIDLTESPEEVGKMLTATGLEVEYIKPFESIRGGLKDLVIGETLTCIKHPNADRLSLTTVDVGDATPHQIVCGAPNVASGQKVVVAKLGTTLYPLQGDPFVINKVKIRGEYSEGMICSAAEIGLEKTHDGIIVLDDNTIPNGTSAAIFYNVKTDYIFEIGLTPNRGDATSHVGVARDLRALKSIPIRWPSIEKFAIDRTALDFSVTVSTPEACPRYTAVTLSEVKVGESPQWLQHRLKSIGISSINNVVDVTNYVCHELGQPLHAFDADQIADSRVVVQTTPSGTPFKALDGKERILTSDDLMICDAREGMCLAGVFGGTSHGITQQTKHVFLESAYFSPTYIRKTGIHHQLKTDASFRFERGTDPNLTVYALKRAALLIKEIAGGFVSSNIIDIYIKKIADKEIKVKDRNVNRLIGKSISRKKIFTILKDLDISIKEKDDDYYIVSVPPYRVGIDHEVDIIEEILRIYGFDNITVYDNASAKYLSHFSEKDTDQYKRVLGEMLTANGYYEIMTNSISRKSYYKKYSIMPDQQAVNIINSSSEDQSMLRQTLLFTGLEVCAHNINRKQKYIKFFEWGKMYWKDENTYKEDARLALYLSGNAEMENWLHVSRPVVYFDLKQQIVSILERYGIIQHVEQISMQDDQRFEYGVKWVKGGSIIGISGKVKTPLLKDFGIEQDVFYADFSMDLLFSLTGAKLEVESITKYPKVRRDLSLLVDKDISFKEIEDLVLKIERKYVEELIVFDTYEGEQVPEGKKAYGLGFILLDNTKTLEDEEINKIMDRLIKALENKMHAIIRKT